MGRWTRNADVVERLSSDFQERYEFSFAWESVCSLYQGIPGLRGFWPMSSINTTGAVDESGQGRNLTTGGADPQFGHDVLIPYFDATEVSADHLRRASEAGLDILGTEAYIQPASRGITFGAWVYFDTAAPLNADMVISKTQNAPPVQVSYALYRRSAAAGGTLRALFNGAATETVDSVETLSAGQWYFLAAKWTPNGERSCFVYNTKATAATALGALQNSGAALELMGRDNGAGGGAETTDGKISLAFLSCMGLHDGVIISLYERSRALFGV